MNSARQGAEIGYSLQLIVRQFNSEMIFQSCEQVQRLQTIYTQSLEKIIVRVQLLAWNFKLCGRKGENFVQSLIEISHHGNYYPLTKVFLILN